MPWPALRACIRRPLVAWMVLATLSVGLGGAAAALGPLALKHVVDAAGRGPGLLPLLAYGAALLLQRACEQVQAYAYGRGELILTRRFSAIAYDHLLRLPLADHLARRSGALAQAVQEGVAGLRLMLAHLVLTALPVLVQLAAGAGVLGSQLGPSLAGVIAGAVLAYGLVFGLAARRLYSPLRGASQGALDAAAVLSDGLMNVETLKACVAEARQAHRYDAALAGAQGHWQAFLRRRLEGGAGAALVFTAAVLASLILVGGDVARGDLTAGDLVLANAFLLQIMRPVEMLGFAARDIGQGHAQLAALGRLLAAPVESAGGDLVPSGEGGLAVAFDQVAHRLSDGRLALDGVSFRIGPGETLAIVGLSGAGKSTVLRLLLGFIQPDRGEVRIDGRPLADYSLPALRRTIALVGQDPILLNETLQANIALGGAAAADVIEAVSAARLGPLVEALPDGLLTGVGERGLALSGGERQRVAIARALAGRARLLVLDEATSALDPATEAEIWEALLAGGVTKVIATHRLPVTRHADQILVLEGGRLVEAGRPAELMARRGAYWRLWRRQGRA